MDRQSRGISVRPTSRKLVAALAIMVPTALVYSAIVAIIPAEDAPRGDALPDGGNLYVLQSLHEAIRLPVLAVLVVGFGWLAGRLLPRDKRSAPPPALPPIGAWKYIVWAGRGLAHAVRALCYLMLFVFLLILVVLEPVYSLRTIEIHENTVRFQSLLRTWSFPRSQITRVDIERTETVMHETRQTDMRLVVQLATGERFTSPQYRHPAGHWQVNRLANILERVKADLLRKPAGLLALPREPCGAVSLLGLPKGDFADAMKSRVGKESPARKEARSRFHASTGGSPREGLCRVRRPCRAHWTSITT